MFSSIKQFIKDPHGIIRVIIRHLPTIKDDELFLKWWFFSKLHYWPNLKNPKTFSEKIQWLKLHNRKSEYTMMVDKYLVRQYIAERLGEEYLIPLIGVYDTPDEIDFDALPNQFVLKCNHNSGLGMCICRDKSKLDIEKVKEGLWRGLKEDYYISHREWPYKDVPRKIVCEEFMVDESGYELKDYKFFCFNGKVKYLKIDFDRQTDHHANYYNPEFELQPFGEADFLPNPDKIIERPESLNEMIAKAEELSKDTPFLRVDFYSINGKVYFGELTFSPASGMGEFDPKEWDSKLGDLIELPNLGGGYQGNNQ